MSAGIAKILLVDDEQDNLDALERTLRSSFEVVTETDAEIALRKVDEGGFAVVVSDLRMPKMAGTEFLAKVAQKNPLISRIILTAHTEIKTLIEAINRAEIYRYITKPWDNYELLATLRQGVAHHHLLSDNHELLLKLKLKEKALSELNASLDEQVRIRTSELSVANEKLSELVITDPLTKVFNRRGFFKRLQEELERSHRYQHPFVLAMIDVDKFKAFNDMEGHLYGDEALRKVAQLLTSNLRRTDSLGRYGGEEFIVLLPETHPKEGIEICQRLRSEVEKGVFQGKKDPAYLTISLGVASFPDHGKTMDEMIKAADGSLYEAKESGRNRVNYFKKSSSFFVP